LETEPEFEDAEMLERLVDPQLTAERLWDERELGEVLEHQMAAPVVADLQTLDNVVALQAAQLCSAARPVILSYRDLFEHPAPPERVLRFVSRFAREQLGAAEPQLPARIARLLYFASAAAARVRLRCAISPLSCEELQAGLQRLAAEPCLDERTRGLLQKLVIDLSCGRSVGSGDAQP
jgi:hypothetical protein